MIGFIAGIVMQYVDSQKSAPSKIALSYKLLSILCNAPSIVEIIKGSAIQRLSIRQEQNAIILFPRKSTLLIPKSVKNLFKIPNSVLNMPTRQSKIEIYAGIAQGSINNVL